MDLQLQIPSLPRRREQQLYSQRKSKNHYVIGVDEAGRGPLAGPVVAAAFSITGPSRSIPATLSTGVIDSKQVTEAVREYIYNHNFRNNDSVKYCVSVIDHKLIDKVNILQATFLAMTEAALSLVKDITLNNKDATFSILIDGNKIPPQLVDTLHYTEYMIKGDGIEFVIAAASICAKVERDAIMHKLHLEFPHYGFSQHKGYGTGAHVAAIHAHGPCKYHRMTFAPIKHMKPKKKVEEVSKKRLVENDGLDDRAERLRKRNILRSG